MKFRGECFRVLEDKDDHYTVKTYASIQRSHLPPQTKPLNEAGRREGVRRMSPAFGVVEGCIATCIQTEEQATRRYSQVVTATD